MNLRRSVVRAIGLAAVSGAWALACGGGVDAAPTPTATATATGVGDPCRPSLENRASFGSFSEQELVIETHAAQCGTGTCLVNHFRGRVGCPYGQDKDGKAPPGASACTLPDGGAVAPADERAGNQVSAQCLDRTAAKAVYCSCRCANVAGKTDDGATYCGCPTGFACTQLVTSIGAKNDELSGAYCMKEGTAYDRASSCSAVCDPSNATCPN